MPEEQNLNRASLTCTESLEHGNIDTFCLFRC